MLAGQCFFSSVDLPRPGHQAYASARLAYVLRCTHIGSQGQNSNRFNPHHRDEFQRLVSREISPQHCGQKEGVQGISDVRQHCIASKCLDLTRSLLPCQSLPKFSFGGATRFAAGRGLDDMLYTPVYTRIHPYTPVYCSLADMEGHGGCQYCGYRFVMQSKPRRGSDQETAGTRSAPFGPA